MPCGGAALEVYLAAVLAAAAGAVVPAELIVCAARLQSDVDAYRLHDRQLDHRQLDPVEPPDEEHLTGTVRALGEAGISRSQTHLQIPAALRATAVHAVLRTADRRCVRRDVVVGWVSTLRGRTPAVFDLLPPLDDVAPGRMIACT